jgi:hypothetical protein
VSHHSGTLITVALTPTPHLQARWRCHPCSRSVQQPVRRPATDRRQMIAVTLHWMLALRGSRRLLLLSPILLSHFVSDVASCSPLAYLRKRLGLGAAGSGSVGDGSAGCRGRSSGQSLGQSCGSGRRVLQGKQVPRQAGDINGRKLSAGSLSIEPVHLCPSSLSFAPSVECCLVSHPSARELTMP